MHQQVQTITIAVSDMTVSKTFYSEGLGWTPILEQDDIVYYRVGRGLVLALFGRFDFAADMGAPIGKEAAFSLGQTVADHDSVDETIDRAREAGARVLKEPQWAATGAYHGYFADPDGHRWEITTGHPFLLGADGETLISPADQAV